MLRLLRPARAVASALLLLAAAAPSARAQYAIYRAPQVVASTSTDNIWTHEQTYGYGSTSDYYVDRNTTNPDGSYAEATADITNGGLRAFAQGATPQSRATAHAWYKIELVFFNANPFTTTQPFKSFFHGTLHYTGTAERVRGFSYADMGMHVYAYDTGTPVLSEFTSMRRPIATEINGQPITSANVAQSFGSGLSLGMGVSRYMLYMGLMVEVGGQHTADFRNTVNLYMPKVDGVTVHANSGVLSQQWVPAWSQSSTPPVVTPEPASLALLGSGLAAIGLVVRRRGAR